MKTVFYLFIAGLMLLFIATSCNKKKTEANTACTITGIVVENDGTSNPVAMAATTLSPSNANTYTGSDGHFEFLDLDAKQYTIQAQKTGYITNRVTVTTVAGGTVNIMIPMDKEP